MIGKPLPHLFLGWSAFLGHSAQGHVFAPDAEPNNTFTTAIPIALGTAFEGQLNVQPGDRNDLESFVLPDDGVLLLEVVSEQAGAAIPYLTIRGHALGDTTEVMPGVAYPEMGTFGTVVADSVQIHCMKAGLHHLRVGATFEDTTTTPRSYRITATHRPMAFASDPEPNNDPASAIPLQQGTWAEGRLSVEWPFNVPGNVFDCYMIHETTAGPLVLHTEFAAEYLNVPVEQGQFQVHDPSLMNISDAEGMVAMGSQGVPASDVATYPTMSDTGQYYVRLHNPTGYGYSYRFSWSVGAVGMSGPDAVHALTITPTSANRSIILSGPAMKLIELFDAGGRSIMQVSASGSDRVDLDMQALAPGTYAVRATLRDGRMVMGRFIKGR